jgi:interleukin-1 receptor-associated kinase 1
VTLNFAEALYSKSEDYSTSGKRVFDIYIQVSISLVQKTNLRANDTLLRKSWLQGMIVKKDVNIKEIPGKEHEERRLQFKVKINDGSLEIKFFWAGKGSLYNQLVSMDLSYQLFRYLVVGSANFNTFYFFC